MNLRIVHKTEYIFDAPVLLDPHVLRLKPMHLDHQQLRSFHLKVHPGPAGLNEELDPEGNVVYFAWFNRETRRLRIISEVEIETRKFNRYNYIIYPFRSARLPVYYRPEDRKVLTNYLVPVVDHSEMKRFVSQTASRYRDSLASFIDALFYELGSFVEQGIRKTGRVLSPVVTFRKQRGSCRDLAWLAIALFRLKGVAARFVSGYMYDPSLEGHELHAWTEVYIPGYGWRGYDPSSGLAVNENYISVAASAFPEHTLPVSGVYRGAAASELTAQVQIEKLA